MADTNPMRVLAIFVMGLLCSGCFVLDELDNGDELMRQASSRSGKNLADEKRQSARDAQWDSGHETSGDDSGMLDGITETVTGWWDQATAEPPREKGAGDELVRCELGSSASFMSKDDCDVRGGRPV
jgi:hypothetical protein